MRAHVLDGRRPALFLQTVPALVLNGDVRYGIYTDRVGREGAATGGVHASRFTASWLEREEAFLRSAHGVYVMGPSTRDVLIEDYGISKSRIMVVGAGSNAPLGSPVPSRPCRRLLFVGTQWELKGGPDLLSAFIRVKVEFPDLELLLVGSAPREPLPGGVTSLGYVPHEGMDAVYSDGDLLVIPTRMEAFGIALVEGLIKGLPCIASTVGNQPWIVGDGGLCVAPGDVDGLVAAIRSVVMDHDGYRVRARERSVELRRTFRWEHVAATIVNDLAAGHEPSSVAIEAPT
jgi:glycosyltransferase involved in cell wall biosynthesis